MSRTPRLLPYLFSAALALSGCAFDRKEASDPVASLRSSEVSRRFDLAYWAAEQRHRSTAWTDGYAFCRGRSEKAYPNCASIRLVGWIDSPPPPPPIDPPAFLPSELAAEGALP